MAASSPRALRRLAVALLALAIVPAGAFAVLQGVIQSESERQLAQIRDDQLDGLLFSVNQDAWDTASLWADRLTRATADTTDFQQRFGFLSGNPAIRYVVESDTTGNITACYGAAVPPGLRTEGDTTGYALAPRVDRDSLFMPDRVRLLLSQHAAGYRKLEPVPLEGGLALLFVADGEASADPPRLLAMVLDPGPFVDDVVMPKLRDVAQGGVDLGVFVEGESAPIASTGEIPLSG
ncbi:MAG: hypothetical protein AAF791_14410, partial [Bacteroidota bacterium]